MGCAGKLFNCSCVLKSCFKAYVLPNLAYCAPVRIPSAEFHLRLLDNVRRIEEKLCEGELCCLGPRRKVSSCICT